MTLAFQMLVSDSHGALGLKHLEVPFYRSRNRLVSIDSKELLGHVVGYNHVESNSLGSIAMLNQ